MIPDKLAEVLKAMRDGKHIYSDGDGHWLTKTQCCHGKRVRDYEFDDALRAGYIRPVSDQYMNHIITPAGLTALREWEKRNE